MIGLDIKLGVFVSVSVCLFVCVLGCKRLEPFYCICFLLSASFVSVVWLM